MTYIQIYANTVGLSLPTFSQLGHYSSLSHTSGISTRGGHSLEGSSAFFAELWPPWDTPTTCGQGKSSTLTQVAMPFPWTCASTPDLRVFTYWPGCNSFRSHLGRILSRHQPTRRMLSFTASFNTLHSSGNIHSNLTNRILRSFAAWFNTRFSLGNSSFAINKPNSLNSCTVSAMSHLVTCCLLFTRDRQLQIDHG